MRDELLRVFDHALLVGLDGEAHRASPLPAESPPRHQLASNPRLVTRALQTLLPFSSEEAPEEESPRAFYVVPVEARERSLPEPRVSDVQPLVDGPGPEQVEIRRVRVRVRCEAGAVVRTLPMASMAQDVPMSLSATKVYFLSASGLFPACS